MTSAEFRRRQGLEPHVASDHKPQIRLPKGRAPNKTEALFERWLESQWRSGTLAKFFYEPITLHLPSGTRYTPDWWVISVAPSNYPTQEEKLSQGVVLEVWEVKGAHIHNSASIRAFKEARAAFPFWSFKFAQLVKGEWRVEE